MVLPSHRESARASSRECYPVRQRLIAQAARYFSPCWLASSHRIAGGLAGTATDGLEREFKTIKQLKRHCARCVHREIKPNRKNANAGGVGSVALANQAAPQNYRGRSRSWLDSRNERLCKIDIGLGGKCQALIGQLFASVPCLRSIKFTGQSLQPRISIYA